MEKARQDRQIFSPRENSLTYRLRRMTKGLIAEECDKNNKRFFQFLKQEGHHWLVKGGWIFTFAMCISLFVYQTCDRIYHYSTYPVAVDVHITRNLLQTLPDITICYPQTEKAFELTKNLEAAGYCFEYFSIENYFYYRKNISLEDVWSAWNTTTALVSAEVCNYSFVSRTGQRCITAKEFSKCEEECILGNTTCRFPFHPAHLRLPPCPINVRDRQWNRLLAGLIGWGNVPKCYCPRKCQHRLFDHRYTVSKLDGNISVYVLRFYDPSETHIEEVPIYNAIQLLCDIGGNSGLYIGVSLLSLFELLYATCWRLYRPRKLFSLSDPLFHLVSRTYSNLKISSETKIPHQSSLADMIAQRSWLRLALKLTFFLSTLSLFLFGSICRIMKYLEYPTRNTIAFSFNSTIIPPSLVVCPGDEHRITLQEKYAKLNNVSNLCDVKIWDLMGLPGINATQLWINYRVGYVGKQKETHFLITHEGTCVELENGLKPLMPKQSLTGVMREDKCMINKLKLYIRPSNKLDFFRYRYVNGNSLFAYVLKEIHVDRRRYVCTTESEHERCIMDCLHKKLYSRIHCSLPYMSGSDLPECNSSQSTKHSHLTYLQLFVNPGATKDCNCFSPCQKRVYETLLLSLNNVDSGDSVDSGKYTSFGLTGQNMILSHLNVPSDSLVKLLGDIGGWLGAVIGLCVLSSIEILLTNIFIKPSNKFF